MDKASVMVNEIHKMKNVILELETYRRVTEDRNDKELTRRMKPLLQKLSNISTAADNLTEMSQRNLSAAEVGVFLRNKTVNEASAAPRPVLEQKTVVKYLKKLKTQIIKYVFSKYNI